MIEGHSEGGLVACKVAADNPEVTHVATLAGGATQLFDLIELARSGVMCGSKPRSSDECVERLLSQWDKRVKNPDSSDEMFLGHPHRRWTSFLATSPAEELKRTKAKVFIGQGTEDNAVLPMSADALDATMRAVGRDVTYSRVPGDHAFMNPKPGDEKNMDPRAGIRCTGVRWSGSSEIAPALRRPVAILPHTVNHPPCPSSPRSNMSVARSRPALSGAGGAGGVVPRRRLRVVRGGDEGQDGARELFEGAVVVDVRRHGKQIAILGERWACDVRPSGDDRALGLRTRFTLGQLQASHARPVGTHRGREIAGLAGKTGFYGTHAASAGSGRSRVSASSWTVRWDQLGPDALTIESDHLIGRFKGSRRSVKAALLDQKVLAGLGNIYADESLFRSRIDPRDRRPAQTRTDPAIGGNDPGSAERGDRCRGLDVAGFSGRGRLRRELSAEPLGIWASGAAVPGMPIHVVRAGAGPAGDRALVVDARAEIQLNGPQGLATPLMGLERDTNAIRIQPVFHTRCERAVFEVKVKSASHPFKCSLLRDEKKNFIITVEGPVLSWTTPRRSP